MLLTQEEINLLPSQCGMCEGESEQMYFEVQVIETCYVHKGKEKKSMVPRRLVALCIACGEKYIVQVI